jgi:NTE family protein
VAPAEIGRLALETRWSDLLRMRIPHAGMVSGDGLERFFERVIPARTFAELRLPFAAVATDLATGRRVDVTSGPLARGARQPQPPGAPGTGGGSRSLLVDGGVQPAPVRAVRETPGHPGVAVDVNVGGPEQPRLNRWLTAVHPCCFTARTAREEEVEADLVIHAMRAACAARSRQGLNCSGAARGGPHGPPALRAPRRLLKKEPFHCPPVFASVLTSAVP